jgi:hypothetical protein
MKIFFRSLLIFATLSMTAQNWCPPGATWYYAFPMSVGNSTPGVIELRYVRDTTINSVNAKIIKGTVIGNFYGYTPMNIYNYRTYITYESNHVVYLYNGSGFDTVVNYRAKFGDQWRMLMEKPDCGEIMLTVVDTGHVIINNLNLRKIKTTATYLVQHGPNIINTTFFCDYIEKINNYYGGGYIYYPLFPIQCPKGIDGSEEYPVMQLCSYKDDYFPLYTTGGGYCNGITSLEEQTFSPGRLTVTGVVTVYNSLGVVVDTIDTGNSGRSELDLGELEKGIYYLLAADSFTYRFTVIKE